MHHTKHAATHHFEALNEEDDLELDLHARPQTAPRPAPRPTIRDVPEMITAGKFQSAVRREMFLHTMSKGQSLYGDEFEEQIAFEDEFVEQPMADGYNDEWEDDDAEVAFHMMQSAFHEDDKWDDRARSESRLESHPNGSEDNWDQEYDNFEDNWDQEYDHFEDHRDASIAREQDGYEDQDNLDQEYDHFEDHRDASIAPEQDGYEDQDNWDQQYDHFEDRRDAGIAREQDDCEFEDQDHRDAGIAREQDDYEFEDQDDRVAGIARAQDDYEFEDQEPQAPFQDLPVKHQKEPFIDHFPQNEEDKEFHDEEWDDYEVQPPLAVATTTVEEALVGDKVSEHREPLFSLLDVNALQPNESKVMQLTTSTNDQSDEPLQAEPSTQRLHIADHPPAAMNALTDFTTNTSNSAATKQGQHEAASVKTKHNSTKSRHSDTKHITPDTQQPNMQPAVAKPSQIIQRHRSPNEKQQPHKASPRTQQQTKPLKDEPKQLQSQPVKEPRSNEPKKGTPRQAQKRTSSQGTQGLVDESKASGLPSQTSSKLAATDVELLLNEVQLDSHKHQTGASDRCSSRQILSPDTSTVISPYQISNLSLLQPGKSSIIKVPNRKGVPPKWNGPPFPTTPRRTREAYLPVYEHI